MAFLKKTRIDGDLTVEGSIKSKYISGNLNEGSTSYVNFPRVNDTTIVDRLVKFEDSSAKLVESLISENIKLSNNYDSAFNTFSFGNKEVDETFTDITINTVYHKINAIDSVLVTLYPNSQPEDGDLYLDIDGVMYSTKFNIGNTKFYYASNLTLYNEQNLGGNWAGLKNICNYTGTWPTDKKGLVLYPTYLVDANNNSNLAWDGSYTSSKLGQNGMTKIGDGLINTNTFVPVIGNKTDSIFHWLDLFNKNQHPAMPNNTGFSDWFIPSYNELKFMLECQKEPMEKTNYWTSGEHSSFDSAWILDSNMNLSALAKSGNAKCLIARYF